MIGMKFEICLYTFKFPALYVFASGIDWLIRLPLTLVISQSDLTVNHRWKFTLFYYDPDLPR